MEDKEIQIPENPIDFSEEFEDVGESPRVKSEYREPQN